MSNKLSLVTRASCLLLLFKVFFYIAARVDRNFSFNIIFFLLIFSLFSFITLSKRYHNSTIVDFQRGGMNLENEKTSDGITSRLMLTKANFRDSGNYSCSAQAPMPLTTSQASSSPSPFAASMILPDSITVLVIDR